MKKSNLEINYIGDSKTKTNKEKRVSSLWKEKCWILKKKDEGWNSRGCWILESKSRKENAEMMKTYYSEREKTAG